MARPAVVKTSKAGPHTHGTCKAGEWGLKNLVLKKKKNYRCRLRAHTYNPVQPQLQSKKADSKENKPQADRQKGFSQSGFRQSEVQSHHTVWG